MIKILAVIIIMVVVNLVMVFAIVKAAGRVESAVRKYYIARLGDEERKEEDRKNKEILMYAASEETAEEKPEAAATEANSVVETVREVEVSFASGSGPDTGKTRYKNSAFQEDYRTMRRMDLLDKEAALSRVVCIQEQVKETGSVYDRILKLLNFDTAFRLNSYGPEEQERLLRESMDPAMCKVLDAFLAVESGSFSAVDFYGWLKEQAVLNSSTYVVMQAKGTGEPVTGGANVRTVEDGGITEGVKIIYKNKLYDYSV